MHLVVDHIVSEFLTVSVLKLDADSPVVKHGTCLAILTIVSP